jgi:hypothetical protein
LATNLGTGIQIGYRKQPSTTSLSPDSEDPKEIVVGELEKILESYKPSRSLPEDEQEDLRKMISGERIIPLTRAGAEAQAAILGALSSKDLVNLIAETTGLHPDDIESYIGRVETELLLSQQEETPRVQAYPQQPYLPQETPTIPHGYQTPTPRQPTPSSPPEYGPVIPRPVTPVTTPLSPDVTQAMEILKQRRGGGVMTLTGFDKLIMQYNPNLFSETTVEIMQLPNVPPKVRIPDFNNPSRTIEKGRLEFLLDPHLVPLSIIEGAGRKTIVESFDTIVPYLVKTYLRDDRSEPLYYGLTDNAIANGRTPVLFLFYNNTWSDRDSQNKSHINSYLPIIQSIREINQQLLSAAQSASSTGAFPVIYDVVKHPSNNKTFYFLMPRIRRNNGEYTPILIKDTNEIARPFMIYVPDSGYLLSMINNIRTITKDTQQGSSGVVLNTVQGFDQIRSLIRSDQTGKRFEEHLSQFARELTRQGVLPWLFYAHFRPQQPTIGQPSQAKR